MGKETAWRPFGEMSTGGGRSVCVYVCICICICIYIRDKISCSSGCPQTSDVTKENLELQILLSPSSERWDSRHMPPPTPCSSCGAGMEPRATQILCQLSYTPSA